MTLLAIFIAVQCTWTWAYRGGSDGFGIPDLKWGNRLLDVLLTPLAAFGALALAHPPVGCLEWGYWLAAVATFALASADGWGRQMDLGANDKPDDETGHRIRDLIFKSKSSFTRDLTGLFMRFAKYLPCALPAALWWGPGAAIPLFMFVGVPLLWVLEHKHFRTAYFDSVHLPWAEGQRVAYVEWAVGGSLAALTVLLILVGGQR